MAVFIEVQEKILNNVPGGLQVVKVFPGKNDKLLIIQFEEELVCTFLSGSQVLNNMLFFVVQFSEIGLG